MRAWKKSAWIGLFAAVAFLQPATARADLKDLLKLVPEDAWGFVVVKSLDNLDSKAAQMAEALGLPLPGAPSDMALGMLQLGDTIDKSSPVCAVMLDAQKFGGPNAMVILVPAKDPKGLLEKLSAEDAKDGISKCTVMGEPTFAAIMGKVVALSPNEDCVTRVSKNKKTMASSLAEARMNVMAKSDVFISISLHAIVGAYKEMFMPMLQMVSGSSGVNPKDIEKYVKAVEELQALDISIGLDKGGFSMTFMAAPVPGSDMEALMSGTKNTSDPLLGLLPKDKFLFTFGATGNQGEQVSKFSSDHPISGFVKSMHEGAELDQKALDEMDSQFLKLQRSIKNYAASISATPTGTDGLIAIAFVAETGGAKEFVEGVRKLYKAACSISADEDSQAIRKAIVHTPDAETVAGKKVDTIKIDFAALPDAGKHEVEGIQTVLGKDSAIRFGAADDKHVVISIGGGADRYAKVCSAGKSGEKLPGDSGITEASGNLPSPRSGEAFVAVDSIFSVVKQGMKAMGHKDDSVVEIPTLNAPVAFSSCVQDKITRIDVMVPMKLIKAGKEAYAKYAASAKDEDFDKDEDDAPAAKKAGAKKKPKAEEDADDDVPAKAKPAPKKPKAAPKKPAKDDDDDSGGK